MLSYDEDDTEGDGGVNFTSWGPTNDRLYTGSSDGVVKVWDIKRGDPFVRDFAKVNTQIMSGAFSHDHEMLMIGEFSGKATLYSTRGDRGVQPQSFKVDKSDITGPEVNVYEAARDLRTRLNMVNEEGYTWMR